MVELHFKYDYNTFGGRPRRSIEKIKDCKIQFYAVSDDDVELIILCPDQEMADKVNQFLAIAYEILPKKTIIR